MKWEMVTHEPVLGQEGYACARCHLRTERCKSDAFSRARCPVWALMKPGRGDMVEDVEARPFAFQGAFLAVNFKAAVLAEREEVLDAPIEEVQAPPPLLGGLQAPQGCDWSPNGALPHLWEPGQQGSPEGAAGP